MATTQAAIHAATVSVRTFGSGTQPPPALAQAIMHASATYGVPPDLLAGIWREESGGTYPNPAVNSSGYGGLFGTRDWNSPTQTQADTAASVLASGLRTSNGDIAGALSYYNSGKTSGGYTSVPGETSFGRVTVPPSTSGQTVGRGVPLPGSGPANPGPQQAVPGSALGNPFSSLSDLIKFVTSWRFAEIVGGILLLIVGLFLVGRSLGVSVPVGPLASPAGSAADAAPGPISAQPRRTQRRAGFTLDADRKPARGNPGSAMLAKGDSLPY
jgi:hypothetical protein